MGVKDFGFRPAKNGGRKHLNDTLIEEMASTIGWEAPIDNFGNWKKNPIRIEDATKDDWVELESKDAISKVIASEDDHISEWLED